MNKNNLILIAGALILFAVMVRFLPHAPNATPIVAIAFVSSMYLGKRWAIILPLTALLLTDLVMGFYDWRIMLSVYGAFTLIGALSWVARTYQSIWPIGFSVIGSSFIFFLITNAAVWLFSPWYAKTIAGLLYSYELGIPFLRNMLVGDIAYTLILVVVFETVYTLSSVKRLTTKTAPVTT